VTHRRVLVAVFVLSIALAGGAARAGFTPAWSYVPSALRAQLAMKSGGVLFLPARTPGFYRYRSGASVTNRKLTVTFTNRVRIREGVWQWTTKTFVWNAQPYAGTCTSYAAVAKTFQLSGNKVYWSSNTGAAWRCVKDAHGHVYVVSATSKTGLGDGGLASVVASGLDVSSRTSGTTVALTVAPHAVRHGGSVLASGIAGGCTAGDQVTIISSAFAATHTFAGVPAVYAQVGSAGRFSARTRIPATRRPGAYTVTARCGGGNLGVSAHLSVTA
jgi:hypothetical protein